MMRDRAKVQLYTGVAEVFSTGVWTNTSWEGVLLSLEEDVFRFKPEEGVW